MDPPFNEYLVLVGLSPDEIRGLTPELRLGYLNAFQQHKAQQGKFPSLKFYLFLFLLNFSIFFFSIVAQQPLAGQ
jgi:hypothetical protein